MGWRTELRPTVVKVFIATIALTMFVGVAQTAKRPSSADNSTSSTASDVTAETTSEAGTDNSTKTPTAPDVTTKATSEAGTDDSTKNSTASDITTTSEATSEAIEKTTTTTPRPPIVEDLICEAKERIEVSLDRLFAWENELHESLCLFKSKGEKAEDIKRLFDALFNATMHKVTRINRSRALLFLRDVLHNVHNRCDVDLGEMTNNESWSSVTMTGEQKDYELDVAKCRVHTNVTGNGTLVLMVLNEDYTPWSNTATSRQANDKYPIVVLTSPNLAPIAADDQSNEVDITFNLEKKEQSETGFVECGVYKERRFDPVPCKRLPSTSDDVLTNVTCRCQVHLFSNDSIPMFGARNVVFKEFIEAATDAATLISRAANLLNENGKEMLLPLKKTIRSRLNVLLKQQEPKDEGQLCFTVQSIFAHLIVPMIRGPGSPSANASITLEDADQAMAFFDSLLTYFSTTISMSAKYGLLRIHVGAGDQMPANAMEHNEDLRPQMLQSSSNGDSCDGLVSHLVMLPYTEIEGPLVRAVCVNGPQPVPVRISGYDQYPPESIPVCTTTNNKKGFSAKQCKTEYENNGVKCSCKNPWIKVATEKLDEIKLADQSLRNICNIGRQIVKISPQWFFDNVKSFVTAINNTQDSQEVEAPCREFLSETLLPLMAPNTSLTSVDAVVNVIRGVASHVIPAGDKTQQATFEATSPNGDAFVQIGQLFSKDDTVARGTLSLKADTKHTGDYMLMTIEPHQQIMADPAIVSTLLVLQLLSATDDSPAASTITASFSITDDGTKSSRLPSCGQLIVNDTSEVLFDAQGCETTMFARSVTCKCANYTQLTGVGLFNYTKAIHMSQPSFSQFSDYAKILLSRSTEDFFGNIKHLCIVLEKLLTNGKVLSTEAGSFVKDVLLTSIDRFNPSIDRLLPILTMIEQSAKYKAPKFPAQGYEVDSRYACAAVRHSSRTSAPLGRRLRLKGKPRPHVILEPRCLTMPKNMSLVSVLLYEYGTSKRNKGKQDNYLAEEQGAAFVIDDAGEVSKKLPICLSINVTRGNIVSDYNCHTLMAHGEVHCMCSEPNTFVGVTLDEYDTLFKHARSLRQIFEISTVIFSRSLQDFHLNLERLRMALSKLEHRPTWTEAANQTTEFFNDVLLASVATGKIDLPSIERVFNMTHAIISSFGKTIPEGEEYQSGQGCAAVRVIDGSKGKIDSTLGRSRVSTSSSISHRSIHAFLEPRCLDNENALPGTIVSTLVYASLGGSLTVRFNITDDGASTMLLPACVLLTNDRKLWFVDCQTLSYKGEIVCNCTNSGFIAVALLNYTESIEYASTVAQLTELASVQLDRSKAVFYRNFAAFRTKLDQLTEALTEEAKEPNVMRLPSVLLQHAVDSPATLEHFWKPFEFAREASLVMMNKKLNLADSASLYSIRVCGNRLGHDCKPGPDQNGTVTFGDISEGEPFTFLQIDASVFQNRLFRLPSADLIMYKPISPVVYIATGYGQSIPINVTFSNIEDPADQAIWCAYFIDKVLRRDREHFDPASVRCKNRTTTASMTCEVSCRCPDERLCTVVSVPYSELFNEQTSIRNLLSPENLIYPKTTFDEVWNHQSSILTKLDQLIVSDNNASAALKCVYPSALQQAFAKQDFSKGQIFARAVTAIALRRWQTGGKYPPQHFNVFELNPAGSSISVLNKSSVHIVATKDDGSENTVWLHTEYDWSEWKMPNNTTMLSWVEERCGGGKIATAIVDVAGYSKRFPGIGLTQQVIGVDLELTGHPVTDHGVLCVRFDDLHMLNGRIFSGCQTTIPAGQVNNGDLLRCHCSGIGPFFGVFIDYKQIYNSQHDAVSLLNFAARSVITSGDLPKPANQPNLLERLQTLSNLYRNDSDVVSGAVAVLHDRVVPSMASHVNGTASRFASTLESLRQITHILIANVTELPKSFGRSWAVLPIYRDSTAVSLSRVRLTLTRNHKFNGVVATFREFLGSELEFLRGNQSRSFVSSVVDLIVPPFLPSPSTKDWLLTAHFSWNSSKTEAADIDSAADGGHLPRCVRLPYNSTTKSMEEESTEDARTLSIGSEVTCEFRSHNGPFAVALWSLDDIINDMQDFSMMLRDGLSIVKLKGLHHLLTRRELFVDQSRNIAAYKGDGDASEAALFDLFKKLLPALISRAMTSSDFSDALHLVRDLTSVLGQRMPKMLYSSRHKLMKTAVNVTAANVVFSIPILGCNEQKNFTDPTSCSTVSLQMAAKDSQCERFAHAVIDRSLVEPLLETLDIVLGTDLVELKSLETPDHNRPARNVFVHFLKLARQQGKDIRCVIFDDVTRTFTDVGATLFSKGDDWAQCHFNGPGLYAVGIFPFQNVTALNILTASASVISVVSLLLQLYLFSHVKGTSVRNALCYYLIVSLITAQLLIIASTLSVQSAPVMTPCSSFIGLLLYGSLACALSFLMFDSLEVLYWMFALPISPTMKHLSPFILYGYVGPIILTIAVYLVGQSNCVGSYQLCLPLMSGVVFWTSVAPGLMVLALNALAIMAVLMRYTSLSPVQFDLFAEQMRSALRSLPLMSFIVVGLWASMLFLHSDTGLAMATVFFSISLLQGPLLLLCRIVGEPNVRKLMARSLGAHGGTFNKFLANLLRPAPPKLTGTSRAETDGSLSTTMAATTSSTDSTTHASTTSLPSIDALPRTRGSASVGAATNEALPLREMSRSTSVGSQPVAAATSLDESYARPNGRYRGYSCSNETAAAPRTAMTPATRSLSLSLSPPSYSTQHATDGDSYVAESSRSSRNAFNPSIAE